jgi:uncharacterized membrane protein
MARYAGEYTETFSVDVPIERAKAHFSDLDAIAKNYGGVAEWKKLKSNTLKLVLDPRVAKGVTFEGYHSMRYTFKTEDVLAWKSVGEGNMTSRGTAHFTAVGKKKTRITYSDYIECEMEANFLVARLIGGIVSRQIRDGIRDYLKRMRAAL